MALLEVKNLGISFGGLKAVDAFNVSIEEGQLYGLIGPNGAGKTTVFNLLTGVYKPTLGTITLDGKSLVGKGPAEICRCGVARTFQNIRLFRDLSVRDNVKAGLHNHYRYSTLEGILRLPAFFRTEKAMNEKAMELLRVDDEDPVNEYYLAKCYERLGNDTKVRDSYENAVRLNPTYVQAFLSYAKYLISQEEYADAQRKLRKALKADSENIELLNLMFYVSYILVKNNVYEYNVKETLSVAEKIEKINPDLFKYPEQKQELTMLLNHAEERK